MPSLAVVVPKCANKKKMKIGLPLEQTFGTRLKLKGVMMSNNCNGMSNIPFDRENDYHFECWRAQRP